jgi:hypothetical protein
MFIAVTYNFEKEVVYLENTYITHYNNIFFLFSYFFTLHFYDVFFILLHTSQRLMQHTIFTILKHQFQRSSCVIFLQKIP